MMHWQDLRALIHHLPHSVGDLLHREDKVLVSAGIPGIVVKPAGDVPNIDIQKVIDPSVLRGQENIALLIRDYLHQLPHFETSSAEAEKLLAHWRKIMTEQPTRIAEAKKNYWHSEKARAFWREHVQHLPHDPLIFNDDWEKLVGTPLPHPASLGPKQEKYWQDLVIRQRLHQQSTKGVPPAF